MSDMMTFPDTWEEFEKLYGFNDAEEIYTNNSRLIPSFRVKQWLDHLPSVQPETAKRIVGKSRGGMTLWYQCDMCNEPVDERDIYCRGCGRRLIDE